MFQGDDLGKVMDVLTSKRCYLYHACQLADFKTYLELGGVASRHLIQSKGKAFTKFDTDAKDQKNGVFDKVFFNFCDFGSFFHNGAASVPNPYGPILIVIDPKALLDCADLAICLRSAGAAGFNREGESLRTLEEVARLFNQSDEVKMREELSADFPDYAVSGSPEASVTVGSGFLAVEHFVKVVVDPLNYNGHDLFSATKSIASQFEDERQIFTRGIRKRASSRTAILNELAAGIASGIETHASLEAQKAVSGDLIRWSQSVKVKWMLPRYARYLRQGTLSHLSTSTKQTA